MPTAYGYLRLSREKKPTPERPSEQALGLDAQAEAIKSWYDAVVKKTHEWGGFFQEQGDCSGSIPIGDRPEGLKLIAKLKEGDAVIFAKLDRGFRNTADLVLTLKTWNTMGIAAHFLDVRLDTSTPVGRMIVQILGIVAEFERGRGAERTREALAAAIARGINVGRPPWGFRGKNGRLYPDAADRKIGAAVIEGIDEHEMSFENLRWKLIGEGHKPMSAASLCRIYWREKQLRTLEEETVWQRTGNPTG